MGLLLWIAVFSLAVSSSAGCLYDRNWQPKNMTSRATIADHVLAGRVDAIFTGNMHYTATMTVVCVYKSSSSGDVTKYPRTVNITVSTARNPSCAMNTPDLDYGRSYILLLTGPMEMGELYAMPVNAQKAEFNLTQENVDDLNRVFGAGIRPRMMGTSSINDSAQPRNCPHDVDSMLVIPDGAPADEDDGEEDGVEDKDVDGEDVEAEMSTQVPSDLKDKTAQPGADTRVGDDDEDGTITEGPTNAATLAVVEIPVLVFLLTLLTACVI